jgi:hypothetical protein
MALASREIFVVAGSVAGEACLELHLGERQGFFTAQAVFIPYVRFQGSSCFEFIFNIGFFSLRR